MGAAANKEIVREIYEAMENGDRSAFGEAMHPDCVWRLAGHHSWTGPFEGQANIRNNLLRPLFNQFAGTYRAKAVNLVGEGDVVVAEVQGDVMTKRGERYDNEYCILFYFRDGKIVQIVEYCDTDLIERVLGPYGDAVADARQRAEGSGAP